MEEAVLDTRLQRCRHRVEHHDHLPAPCGVLADLTGRTAMRSLLYTSVCISILAASVAAVRQQPKAGGKLVFIGTYTGEKTGSKGIYAFRFDDATGALTPLGLKAETANPSFLATNAAGSVLYAVNETGNFNGEKAGSVSTFSVDKATGSLTPVGTALSTGGADPCH